MPSFFDKLHDSIKTHQDFKKSIGENKVQKQQKQTDHNPLVKNTVAKIVAASLAVTGGFTAANMYHSASSSIVADKVEDFNAKTLKSLTPKIEEIIKTAEEDDNPGSTGKIGLGVSGNAPGHSRTNPEDVDLESDDIYKDLNDTNWTADATQFIDVGGIKCYANIPLPKTPKAFYVNVKKADEVWWKLVKSNNLTTKYGPGHSIQSPMGQENSGALSNHVVGGVTYLGVGIGPAIVSKSYYTDKYWCDPNKNGAADAVSGPRSNWPTSIAVVKDRASGKKYYVPLVYDDSKAHTFPMGFMQTCISVRKGAPSGQNNLWSASDWIDASGSSKDLAHYAGVVDTSSHFQDAWNYIVQHPYGVGKNASKAGQYPPDHYGHYMEIRRCNSSTVSAFNSKFTMEGFITLSNDGK